LENKIIRIGQIAKVKTESGEVEIKPAEEVCGGCVNWTGRADGFCTCEKGPYQEAGE